MVIGLLPIASKVRSKHPRRAKYGVNVSCISKKPNFGGLSPHGGGQKAPNHVSKRPQNDPKIEHSMYNITDIRFLVDFGGLQERFSIKSIHFSKLNHMHMLNAADLRFLKDVLSVLHVFGDHKL